MSNRGKQHDRVVTVPFRLVASTNISKVANTIAVSELELLPGNLGTRVAAIGACFEYYRIHKLNATSFSTCVGPTHYDSTILNVTLGTQGGIQAIAYEPSDSTRTGTPSTLNGVMECAEAMCGSFYDRLRMKIPKSTLLGTPLKWWNTSNTGTPTETLVQGLLYTYTFNLLVNDAAYNDIVNVLLEGEIQFKGMIPPSISALETKTSDWDTLSVPADSVVERPIAVDPAMSASPSPDKQVVKQRGRSKHPAVGTRPAV